MASTVASEAVDILEAAGLGTPGTNLFEYRLPDTPHQAIAVIPYPGAQPMRHHGESVPGLQQPRFQVRCRATDDASVDDLADRAFRALCAAMNRDVAPGVAWLAVRPLQDPFPQPEDQSRRMVRACNFEVLRRVA